MTLKSVLEIDVNDDKFKRFQTLFGQYQEQLKKTPGNWDKMAKASGKTRQEFEKTAAAMLAHNKMVSEADNAEAKRRGNLQNVDKLWVNIAKSSKEFAGHVIRAGESLLKWGAIIFGGLTFGGLFGIDRMAAGAAGERRSAMGRGMSIGEQQAFRINFGRLVDPEAFLGSVNDMMTDPRKMWSLYSMGVNPHDSTENVSVNLLKAMRQRAQGTDTANLGLLGTQTGVDVGTDTWRRLHDMGDKEFNQLLASNAKDVGALNIADPAAKKWTDFMNQIDRAKDSIHKIFVEGLVGLEQPLEHLSAAFVKFLGTFMGSPKVKKWIDELAGWLEHLSVDLMANKFQHSVETLINGVDEVVSAFMKVVDFVEGAIGAGRTFGDRVTDDYHKIKEGIFGPDKEVALGKLSRADRAFNLQPGTLEFLWKRESGQQLSAPTSKKGAVGPFQIMPDLAKKMGIDPTDFGQAAYYAGKNFEQYLTKYHGDYDKAIAAWNWGEGNVDKLVAEHPKGDWEQYLGKNSETRDYINAAHAMNLGTGARPPALRVPSPGGVHISITNATGGNTNVAAVQQAP